MLWAILALPGPFMEKVLHALSPTLVSVGSQTLVKIYIPQQISSFRWRRITANFVLFVFTVTSWQNQNPGRLWKDSPRNTSSSQSIFQCQKMDLNIVKKSAAAKFVIYLDHYSMQKQRPQKYLWLLRAVRTLSNHPKPCVQNNPQPDSWYPQSGTSLASTCLIFNTRSPAKGQWSSVLSLWWQRPL